MTNLVNKISEYIKNSMEVEIFNDLFPSAEFEGVIAIHDPAERNIIEYIDGSREFQINISYTARYSDAEKAREVLTDILDLLDGLKLKDDADNMTLKIKAVANVQFIGTDDKNNNIYTCSVNAAYRNN